MDVVARARALAERGRRSAAIELLKPFARAERPPYEARRALAQLYRDRDAPDQAGRWGIAIEGWTTAVEQDRLARALVPYVEPRTFLSLPMDAPEPADLPAVLALRAEHSERGAERHRRAAESWSQSPEARAARRGEGLAAAVAVLVVVGAVGPSMAVAIARLLARDPWALLAAGAGWGLLALASLLIPGVPWIEERRMRLVAIGAGLAMAGIATACVVLAAHWAAHGAAG